MQLERLAPGQFSLNGIVNFDNAVEVESEGRKLLEKDIGSGGVLRVSLANLLKGDSSTLSVCLSWIRLAQEKGGHLCLSDMPEELAALARVCGVEPILQESTCS
ncbi:STAS domain-containing protein [Endozoicomonas arenosclerae]|uniref:STAS domain-containing protein n=1 Tax=Endozoicomonas arenosclerae TaxID=1633495 RepID=UPI000783F51B|nr:STAS domain-containing protein [Endozoicomonas arenosclerae]